MLIYVTSILYCVKILHLGLVTRIMSSFDYWLADNSDQAFVSTNTDGLFIEHPWTHFAEI